MSLFEGFFDDFGLFRQICFYVALLMLLLLLFVWPALANLYGTNAPAVYYTVAGMCTLIGLGFAGATIPFLLNRSKGYSAI